MTDFSEEIQANFERARQSLQAAQTLLDDEYEDFAASRAYYAVFYAATALLLKDELERGKHSGVIAGIHQHFVKIGKLSKELGRDLNWLFELRSVGDYGGVAHVSHIDAEKAIEVAKQFMKAAEGLILP